MQEPNAGADDLAFLGEIIGIAEGLYSRKRRRQPFGAYMDADGMRTMIAPKGGGEGEGEEDVMDALRLACMKARATRTAIAYERLEFDTTDDSDAADVEAWLASGKDPGRHPKARMTLIVTVESEAGIASQTCAVNQPSDRRRKFVPRDPAFGLRGEALTYDPMLTGHYVPLAARLDPDLRRWAADAVTDLVFSTLDDEDTRERRTPS